MKKVLFFAFMGLFALSVSMMSSCSSDGGGNGDGQITLPNQSEKIQEAFADEETTGGFTFAATASWTATVAETSGAELMLAAPRSSGVSWLRLLFEGQEKYNGGAGTFRLTIELDPNYTGATRSATITIVSGSNRITITVTQEGETQEGIVPENPNPSEALIRKIVYNDGGPNHETLITYNGNAKVTKIVGRVASGASFDTTSVTNIAYSAGKITANEAYKDPYGESGTIIFEATLNSSGYATETIYKEKLDSESVYDKSVSALEYNNSYLKKVTYDYMVYWESDGGQEPSSGSWSETAESTCTWDANGNLIEIQTDYFQEREPDRTEWANHKIQYGSNLNNSSLDINAFLDGGGIPGAWGIVTNVCGKSSKNLKSKVETQSAGEMSGGSISTYQITFDYTFKDGKLVKIESSSSSYDYEDGTYEFFY